MGDNYDVAKQGERRHMIPDNLTPIMSLFDERFEKFKTEIKAENKEYLSMLEKTYMVRLDQMDKNIEEAKNGEDIKALEERLNERFLTKMDILNNTVIELKMAITKDQDKLEKKIEDHDNRINSLEKGEAERAKKLLQKIKDNAIAWIVPTLIVALLMALGLNIPKIK